jgi:methylated-DNA-[protein]-cysteine S-methyltransferase
VGALHRDSIETPVGDMLAISSASGLAALEFDSPDRFHRLERRLERWYSPYTIVEESSPFIDHARAWLTAYFAGETLPDVELDVRGTPFEKRVWDLLLEIPLGETRTYGELAKTFGSINRARAVGLAVGSNPAGVIIPCHRVIGSTGSLTGYGGGLERKKWLLAHEANARPSAAARLF